MEDGKIVIGDLLVKDYPIILRFTGASSPSQGYEAQNAAFSKSVP
jgi:hypothetical protein